MERKGKEIFHFSSFFDFFYDNEGDVENRKIWKDLEGKETKFFTELEKSLLTR